MNSETTIMKQVSESNKNKASVFRTKRAFSTKQMVIIAMFSALSYVLMFIKFPIAYLGFLEFEFSDIPALVAGLSYGPVTAIVIELIKNLIKGLTSSFTGGVGELANFLVSSAFMLMSCGLYRILKGRRKAVISFSIGTLVMTLAGAIMNYFVLLPLYAKILGGMDGILGVATQTIPAINSVGTLVVIGISPFNVFKGLYVSLIGLAIYKLLRKVLQDV